MDPLFLGALVCPLGMAAIAGVAWISGRTLGADSPTTGRVTRISCLHHRRSPGKDGSSPARTAKLPTAGPQTFLFADLAGFTALTEANGDEHAADVARRFARDVRLLLPDYGAEEVKSLGDGLMIRTGDAAAAVRLALRVVGELHRNPGFPPVRAGVHTGPAVERDGDWFGATVNLAARVAAIASGGQVVVTEEVADAVRVVGDIELAELPLHELRNVAKPVKLFAAHRPQEAVSRFPAAGIVREEVELHV